MAQEQENISATHGDILRAVGNIEGTLKTFIATNEVRLAAMEKTQDVHGIKIENLKVRQARWAGAAAVIGSVAGYFFGVK